jgi:hypothetical protein
MYVELVCIHIDLIMWILFSILELWELRIYEASRKRSIPVGLSGLQGVPVVLHGHCQCLEANGWIIALAVGSFLFHHPSFFSHGCCLLFSHIYISISITALSAVNMAGYDLDFGKKNAYVPAKGGDGGQGSFGAVSPSDWRVPGTSPVGQASYGGAADGGDEPWFSEAVSTVSLDLKKADDTLKAFTKEAAEFKIAAFAAENNVNKDKAYEQLVGAMGYDKFLEASAGQLKKEFDKLSGGGAKKAAAKEEAKEE